jgi:hypothetical protein
MSLQGSALRKAQAANDLSGAWFVGTYGDDEMQNPLGLVLFIYPGVDYIDGHDAPREL